MSLVEVMGQCAKCKDLITIELTELAGRKNAQVHMRGKYYRFGNGRTYQYTAQRLVHRGIVTPCLGQIYLRGGMTPLTLQHDDEPSIYPQFRAT